MIKFCRIALAVSLTLTSVGVLATKASESVESLPTLAPESQHATASKRITARFTRGHYKKVKISDSDPFFFTRLEQKMKNQEEMKNKSWIFGLQVVGVRKFAFSLLLAFALFGGLWLGDFSSQNINHYNSLSEEQFASEMNFEVFEDNFNLIAESE